MNEYCPPGPGCKLCLTVNIGFLMLFAGCGPLTELWSQQCYCSGGGVGPLPTPGPHYGSPPCLEDDELVVMESGRGYCAPSCDSDRDCPADAPSGDRSEQPKCGLILPWSKRGGHCYIPCLSSSDCAHVNATFVDKTLEKGVCVYDIPEEPVMFL